jgi:hypothetical protein
MLTNGTSTHCPALLGRLGRLRTEPLREIDEWLAPYRAAWAGRLGALESHLDDMDN